MGPSVKLVSTNKGLISEEKKWGSFFFQEKLPYRGGPRGVWQKTILFPIFFLNPSLTLTEGSTQLTNCSRRACSRATQHLLWSLWTPHASPSPDSLFFNPEVNVNSVYALGCFTKTCFLWKKMAQPALQVFGSWFEGIQKDFWFYKF